MGVGRNLSYKKAVFLRHKGFTAHNNIASGDDDLFIKTAATPLNTKINIDADTFTLSDPAKTFSQWLRQKKRHYTTAKYYKPVHKFLLGLYSFSHFLFYPLFAASIVFYGWPYALAVFGTRFIMQAVVFYLCMKKLQEKDLYPWFLLFDIWMFFYYIIFSVTLIKKPGKGW
jgi:hypothetical protein